MMSLPQYFKQHGYTVLGHSKLYHPGHPQNYDEPLSWSPDQPYFPLDDDKCDGLVQPIGPYAQARCTPRLSSAISAIKTSLATLASVITCHA